MHSTRLFLQPLLLEAWSWQNMLLSVDVLLQSSGMRRVW